MELPDSNREALAQYITEETAANGEVNPSADNNWDFVTINTSTELDIRFETQDSELADKFILENQLRPLTKRADLTDEFGFAIYNIDLTTEATAK